MRLQSQRQGALALVCAFLLAQIAGFVHLALERHAVCAEHGELLHVAASDVAAGHRAPEGHPEGPALGGFEGTGHADCGVLMAVQPKHGPAAAPVARALAAPAVCLRPALPAEAAHVAVPLLLLAPKQSPPAERRAIG